MRPNDVLLSPAKFWATQFFADSPQADTLDMDRLQLSSYQINKPSLDTRIPSLHWRNFWPFATKFG